MLKSEVKFEAGEPAFGRMQDAADYRRDGFVRIAQGGWRRTCLHAAAKFCARHTRAVDAHLCTSDTKNTGIAAHWVPYEQSTVSQMNGSAGAIKTCSEPPKSPHPVSRSHQPLCQFYRPFTNELIIKHLMRKHARNLCACCCRSNAHLDWRRVQHYRSVSQTHSTVCRAISVQMYFEVELCLLCCRRSLVPTVAACLALYFLSLSAAPVGDKPAHSKGEAEAEPAGPDGQQPQQPLFPHIYGPIDSAAVVAELAVKRSEAGAFLSIEGLC